MDIKEEIFKIFKKYGIFGMILLYFLYMDFQYRVASIKSREAQQIVTEKAVGKLEAMGEKIMEHDVAMIQKRARMDLADYKFDVIDTRVTKLEDK
jgi:hypothetical protein